MMPPPKSVGRDWHKLKERLPEKGQVVWCHRKGKTSEYRLSRRMSDKPLTIHEDLSRDDFWKGAGPHSGYSWSDATVLEWAPSEFEPIENMQEALSVLREFTEENLTELGENMAWVDMRARDAIRFILKECE